MHTELEEQRPQLDGIGGTVKDTLRQFIINDFMVNLDPSVLTDDMSFEGAHLVDSAGMMELIMFVEETFEIEVENEEALPENFDSIDNLAAFVARKQAG